MTVFHIDSKQCKIRNSSLLFSLLVVLILTACSASSESNDTGKYTITAIAEANANIGPCSTVITDGKIARVIFITDVVIVKTGGSGSTQAGDNYHDSHHFGLHGLPSIAITFAASLLVNSDGASGFSVHPDANNIANAATSHGLYIAVHRTSWREHARNC